MATQLQRTKLPDDITRYNTSAKPAVSAQPAAKLITGNAVTPQPAATQQSSPGQQAQAAPKPAPTWRQGNSVSNGYQQDRASELFQKGMSSTNAARQGAADSQRMAAAWKNAPKVDEKSLSVWGKDSTGKFRMLKAGSTTPGGVTAPTTAPKAAAVKVTTPATRQESPLAKSWRQPIAKQPTPMRTQSLTQAAGFAAKPQVKAAAVKVAPSPTKSAAPGERFRSPMAPAAPTAKKAHPQAATKVSASWGGPKQSAPALVPGPFRMLEGGFNALTQPETADYTKGGYVYNKSTKVGKAPTGSWRDLPLDERMKAKRKSNQSALAKK